jgi:hypothetical protein
MELGDCCSALDSCFALAFEGGGRAYLADSFSFMHTFRLTL